MLNFIESVCTFRSFSPNHNVAWKTVSFILRRKFVDTIRVILIWNNLIEHTRKLINDLFNQKNQNLIIKFKVSITKNSLMPTVGPTV